MVLVNQDMLWVCEQTLLTEVYVWYTLSGVITFAEHTLIHKPVNDELPQLYYDKVK